MSPDESATDLFLEQPVWKHISGVWRPLHGGFASSGVSLEWHDFHLGQDLDWSPSFHPGSLEVCLNFSGQAQWQAGEKTHALAAGDVALYTANGTPLPAQRLAGSLHRFLTIELSPDYLRTHFEAVAAALKPGVRRFLESGGTAGKPFLEILPMPITLLNIRLYLLEPPVAATAQGIWYQGKILDVLAQVLFREDKPVEPWSEKHERENRDRLARVVFWLERDYENPPSLEMLAAEVGCSVFHLSRLFSQKMGLSIPRFIRLRRIERAAELLRGGGKSVTEVAMMVGYSSLSAFNKAFVEQIGCCPGLYPHMKAPTKSS